LIALDELVALDPQQKRQAPPMKKEAAADDPKAMREMSMGQAQPAFEGPRGGESRA